MEKRKKTSLSLKFSLFIIPLIIIGISVLLFTVYFRVNSGVFDLQKETVLQSSIAIREEFDILIESSLNLLRTNATNPYIIEDLKFNTSEKSTILLKLITQGEKFFDSVDICDRKGNIIISSNSADLGKNVSDRDYFKEIILNSKDYDIQEKAVTSKLTGEYVFVIASAIKDNNETIGMIFAPMNITKMSKELLLTKKFGDRGYPFIVDSNAFAIAHPDPKIVDTYVDVTEKAAKSTEKIGFYGYTFQSENKYMAFSKMNSINWTMCTSIYETDLIGLSISLIPILILIGVIVTVSIIVVILFVVRFLISKPLKKVDDMLETISKGDLTVEQSIAKSRDEIGSLTSSANIMLSSLQNMVIHINTSVEQITIGTNQISDSSQSLSTGASKQAASLEEITASINEIASQVQSNVENARKTNEIANQTSDNAIRGNNQMKELVLAMEDINKSAQEIKNIVKVIDEIAFQTNLLALNADIEAARVGKYGRGFAVVANSVRTLAGRSAIAVKETTDMVEKAINNVNHGNELVKKTAEQLENITHDASEVTRLATEVADASQEQANGIEQISTGLGQIEEVTQSNSANAEENAAASEELASQSSELKELVSYFKVRSGEISYSKDTSQKNTKELDNRKSLTPYLK